MSYTVTVTETPFVVTVDDSTTVEVSASDVLTVELGYGDASVGAYLLALLTNNTALGRLSDAIAAIDALSQAEAENATSDVVGLATGRRLAQGAAVAVTAHVAEVDPHTQYTTDAEAGGIAAAAVTTHVALSDPHTQYQKESEKDAASGYAGLDGSTLVLANKLGTGTPGATTLLTGDRAWAGGVSDDEVPTLSTAGTAIGWRAPLRVIGIVSSTTPGTGCVGSITGSVTTFGASGTSGFDDYGAIITRTSATNGTAGIHSPFRVTLAQGGWVEVTFRVTVAPGAATGLVWAGLCQDVSPTSTFKNTGRLGILYDPAVNGNGNFWTYIRNAGAADTPEDLNVSFTAGTHYTLRVKLGTTSVVLELWNLATRTRLARTVYSGTELPTGLQLALTAGVAGGGTAATITHQMGRNLVLA